MCKLITYIQNLIQGFHSNKTEILKVRGTDILDFFNRISTNRFVNFSDSTFIKTLFLSPKGKIIDFCTVINTGDEYCLICTNGNGRNLQSHLEKYTVTEDIKVVSEEATVAIFTGEDKIFDNFDFAGNKIVSAGESFLFRDGYGFDKIVIIEYGLKAKEYLNELKNISKKIAEEEFGTYCMRNFYLNHTNELNEGNNPLECYLDEFISFSKGCYIGQEVIARIDSQDKIPRKLVYIESVKKMNKGDIIVAKYGEDENECGNVTSVVGFNNIFSAYGFVKSDFFKKENKYFINGEEIFLNYKNN